MKPGQKKIIVVFCVVIGVLLLVKADYYLLQLLSAAAGIEAKMLCSGVFVSERDPESVLNEDLHRSVNYIRRNVNHVEKSATATAFGVITRRAIFRKGLGCTLIAGTSEEELRSQVTVDLTSRQLKKKNLPWPVGDVISKEDLPTDIDVQKLSVVLDKAFSEPDPKRLRQTRAVVIVYKRHLIAEQYAEGFTKDTPLLGYGMTKSVINALVGILVYQGKLSIEEPALVPEWSTPGDPRSAITLDQLLRMSSGLKFDDSHPPLTDSIIMFGSHDMAAYASDKPLVEDPDTRWSNSNGTTNIIARIIRKAVGGSQTDYFKFPRRELFNRIGMNSAIIEPDASGTFVGSTYMYATARDWARFGILYLQDSIWESERILPEGWITYSRTPTPTNPSGEYGAHFWLNTVSAQNNEERRFPNIPSDAFFALGHDEQSLTIIPSHKLVVVRLGLTKNPEAWDLDLFISEILKTINE